jgi:hypothetical protein
MVPGSETSTDEAWLRFSAILSHKGFLVEDITDAQVPESLVCQYFGKKSSKSGWKFQKHTSAEDATSIYQLWRRVFDSHFMPNKEITLQFARGLIMQSQGEEINWAEFAVSRQKYRESMRQTKEQNKKSKGGEDGSLVRVPVIGKKRCIAERDSILLGFKLSVKTEVYSESEMGKKQCCDVKGSLGKKKGKLDLSPSWVDGDLKDMASVITSSEKTVEECRAELEQLSAEKEELESEVRRARILLSDREVMLSEGILEVAKLDAEESCLKKKISESSLLDVGGMLTTLEAQCDEVSFNKKVAERTITLSRGVVKDCEATIARVENLLQESTGRCSVVSKRVLSLEGLLGGMEDQLRRMNEGGGNILFPRPMFGNPEAPPHTVHVLNACPVCGFWYNCHNFVPLSCGHTYHLWCLTEHAKKSATCLVDSCTEPASLVSNIGIGIRLAGVEGKNIVVKSNSLSLPKSEQGTTSNQSGDY